MTDLDWEYIQKQRQIILKALNGLQTRAPYAFQKALVGEYIVYFGKINPMPYYSLRRATAATFLRGENYSSMFDPSTYRRLYEVDGLYRFGTDLYTPIPGGGRLYMYSYTYTATVFSRWNFTRTVEQQSQRGCTRWPTFGAKTTSTCRTTIRPITQ